MNYRVIPQLKNRTPYGLPEYAYKTYTLAYSLRCAPWGLIDLVECDIWHFQ